MIRTTQLYGEIEAKERAGTSKGASGTRAIRQDRMKSFYLGLEDCIVKAVISRASPSSLITNVPTSHRCSTPQTRYTYFSSSSPPL